MPHVVLSNQFDANSNRTQLSATIGGVADFLSSYSYDALNELTQLYQQGRTGGNAVATKGANLTYNALGQLATIARTNYFGTGPAPDIATSTFSYDAANRLTVSFRRACMTDSGGRASVASWHRISRRSGHGSRKGGQSSCQVIASGGQVGEVATLATLGNSNSRTALAIGD